MKKIYLFLFIIISFFSFSNKGNYDDTKFRQDLINWANSKIGQSYSMNDRWGATTFDCSSFISRGLGATGMISISGKKSDYGTTANGLYKASGQIVKGTGTAGLKAGDIAHFSAYSSGTTGHVGIITEVIDGCRVRMTHASNSKPYPKGGVKSDIKNLCKDSHYLGATSASQILINNGYTPLNTDGSVITPDGSAVGNGGGELVGMVDTGYIVDFDGILQEYTNAIKNGLNNFAQTLVVLLTYVAVLDFMYFYITTPNKNLEYVVREFGVKLCKFFLFLLIIRNMNNINEFAYKMCFDIAKVFVGEPKYHLNDVFEAYLVNCKSLLVFFSKINILDILSGQLTVKVTTIIAFIVLLTFIFCMIMGQIVITLMNFFVGVNLSCIFLPFRYSNYTQGYFPDPFGVMITNCLKLIVNIILITISLKIIGTKAIPDTTVNDFDIAAIMCFIVYFGITAAVLFESNKKIGNMI